MYRLGKGIILLALGLLLPLTGCNQSWGVKELETEKTSVSLTREVERGRYGIVSTEELKSMLDKQSNVLLIDTMPFEASYKKNHIPGAVHMEFPIPEMTELDANQQDELRRLLGSDLERPVVFYCGFTKCTRSHNGAMWAKKLGYSNVYRHPGGIKGWMEAGYPVSKLN